MSAPTASLEQLILDYLTRAASVDFAPARDLEVYAKWQRDPDQPVIIAGNLDAPICFLGRDLGKDEVRYQEPLIGAAGRAIRKTLHAHYCAEQSPDPPQFKSAMHYACITNTVPYKPIGNAPFAESTREAFRDLVETFLTSHWRGHILIPLGLGALEWCAPYDPDAIADLLRRPIPGWVDCAAPLTMAGRRVTIWPLPHPSPLSQYARQVPGWLMQRLQTLDSA